MAFEQKGLSLVIKTFRNTSLDALAMNLNNLKLICRGGCPLRRIWNQEDHLCEVTKRLVPQLLGLFYEDPSYVKIFIKK